MRGADLTAQNIFQLGQSSFAPPPYRRSLFSDSTPIQSRDGGGRFWQKVPKIQRQWLHFRNFLAQTFKNFSYENLFLVSFRKIFGSGEVLFYMRFYYDMSFKYTLQQECENCVMPIPKHLFNCFFIIRWCLRVFSSLLLKRFNCTDRVSSRPNFISTDHYLDRLSSIWTNIFGTIWSQPNLISTEFYLNRIYLERVSCIWTNIYLERILFRPTVFHIDRVSTQQSIISTEFYLNRLLSKMTEFCLEQYSFWTGFIWADQVLSRPFFISIDFYLVRFYHDWVLSQPCFIWTDLLLLDKYLFLTSFNWTG